MIVNKYARFFTIVFIFNWRLKMFGKLRSSLRKSLRWKSSRDRHANRGGDGGDAILGGGSSSAGSSVPHHAASSASSSQHGDATPSHSGGSGVAASTADNNASFANNKVPRQWQLDESAVRAGTCAFAVKYLGCAEVFESRGMHVCEQALVLLRDNVVHRKPQRAILYVTGEGLRVVDSKSRNLLVDQTIEKVSFCSPDRNHSKGFAYICRDGTTRRWICHGFNAVADTGERLSHAVGCAFQECLQRKQLREKQLRVKQQNEPAPTGIQSNTAEAARLSLTTIEAAVPKPMVTGNQMNSNFQRNTHRTQSLADRRIDPQAFVKVDKSVAAPAQQQQPDAADNGVDLQPQEFRRAQSSRVFSTQFVRQRLRSSIRSPVPTSTNASQQSPQNDASRSSQQQQFADSVMRQNVDGGFYNPSINFASPTGPEPQPALSSAHYGTNSTFLPASTASNSISSPSYNNSPPPPPPPASSLTMQNEILDLVSRINNQDFSGGGLSSVKTTATADAAFSPQQHATGLRLSRPYVTPSLPQSRPTVDTSTTAPWSYAARYSVAGGVPPVVANRNAVPIPPRNTMQNSTNRSTTAVGAENTQNSSFFTNGSSNVNRTIPQRPNQLPTVPLKHQHPGTVAEEEDPFSPPGWVDKSSTGFAPFSPLEKVADQQQRDESVRTWSPVSVDYNSNTFHNNSSPQVTPLKPHQQHQRSSAFGVPFNQLREEENGVLAAGGGGGSRTRTPTPAGPTMSAANGTVDSGMVYVPADYFVRQKKSSNNVQESDPFNTTWVKLDTE